MEQYTDRIGSLVAKRIPEFQFQKRERRLFRSTDIGWQAVVLKVLPTATRGVGKLAAHAQVRHDRLEALYLPHHLYIEVQDAEMHPTLTVNCDTRLQGKSLVHGFSLEPASVDAFAEEYAEAIKADIMPWLERFSDEQALYDGLASSDPKNWVTSDRLIRFPVLMALLSSRGDASTFDSVASEFQEWCKQKHALVYAPLAVSMLNMRPHV